MQNKKNTDKVNLEDKLTVKEKCGYGSAAVGDAIAYAFMTTFMMFFLTTVAEIQPAVAGTLTAIGAIWNALVNPIIGYISDHACTKWGRRRPFMLGFCLPLFASIILLYTAIEVNDTVKVFYYGFMILAFWTSFTGFFVPFYALGAEYTNGYGERATLRSYASFFNMIGTLFSMAMPTMIVEFFTKSGITVEKAWQLTAIFLAILTVASILITVFASKDKDICQNDLKPNGGLNIKIMLLEYVEVLKLKPMKWLLFTSLFYLTGYAIIMSDLVYFLTYNMGFDGNGVSLAMIARTLIIIIFIPLVNKLILMTDKRIAQLIVLSFAITGMTAIRFIGIDGILALGLFLFIAAITTQTYWQIMPAIFYDVCEYDEYETGKRREGSIVSVQGLVEAIASGFGTQILGIILQLAGFAGNADVQSQEALEWVFNCTTCVPAIFLICAGISLYKYPITKERYNEIVDKLNKRKSERQ